jgi:hypothetical protein
MAFITPMAPLVVEHRALPPAVIEGRTTTLHGTPSTANHVTVGHQGVIV